MICVCVKANIWFTYQKEYEINYDDASGDITVKVMTTDAVGMPTAKEMGAMFV